MDIDCDRLLTSSQEFRLVIVRNLTCTSAGAELSQPNPPSSCIGYALCRDFCHLYDDRFLPSPLVTIIMDISYAIDMPHEFVCHSEFIFHILGDRFCKVRFRSSPQGLTLKDNTRRIPCIITFKYS